jgi:predicted ATP-grasp superfamily ATP-dependent carboligase
MRRAARRSRRVTESVGAVVVGGDYQGLGIVRSLGRRGVPTFVVDDERSIARFSRFTDRFEHVDELREPEQAVESLLDIGRRNGLEGWVLYPTREETVAAFSRHKERLSTVFRVPTPGWDTIKWAWDKRNTYRLAEQLGIPAPRTWYPRSIDELKAIDGRPPFALKPAVKENFVYATKAKAWRADSFEELERLYAEADAIVGDGEVMIQELIPGGGSQQLAYCAFFKDGEAIGTMLARRNRQHPPEFGRASTFVETIELPELEELSKRFLRHIDYYGLVELEYKLDERDGRHKLLDVNARTWGYHSLGFGAGVDFPYLLWADQLGRPVERCRSRSGVRWIRLVTDLPVGAVEVFGGRMDWRAYMRSLRRINVEAVFSREDPMPGVAELALIPYLSLKRGF